jgi:hypothetical protein
MHKHHTRHARHACISSSVTAQAAPKKALNFLQTDEEESPSANESGKAAPAEALRFVPLQAKKIMPKLPPKAAKPKSLPLASPSPSQVPALAQAPQAQAQALRTIEAPLVPLRAPAALIVADDDDVENEYDPAQPNDYNTIIAERKEAKERVRQQRKVERHLAKIAKEQEQVSSIPIATETAQDVLKRRAALAGIAPPEPQTEPQTEPIDGESIDGEPIDGEPIDGEPIDGEPIDGEPIENVDMKRSAEVEERNVKKRKTKAAPEPEPEPQPDTSWTEKGERMMALMGWRAGQGLGREAQGIKAPLLVMKGVGTARVVDTDDTHSKLFGQASTRTLLLLNAASPEQVSESIAGELAVDCSEYGEVEQCIMHVVQVREKEKLEAQVRVFVRFTAEDAARRALQNLNQRHFMQRVLDVHFYNDEAFDKNELNRSVE